MEKLINLTVYTPLEVILFGICCVCWFGVYIITIINIHRYQKIDIPVSAIVANFSWELLWSWVHETNMGPLFQWGYRIWFFLDAYIVYSMFKYGGHQFLDKNLKSNYKSILAAGLVTWLVLLWFMIPEYDKDQMGMFTAFVINIYMSIIYCFQIIREPGFSINKWSGWLKMLGTGICSVMAYLHFGGEPGYQTLFAIGVLTFVFDSYYIWLSYKTENVVEVKPGLNGNVGISLS